MIVPICGILYYSFTDYDLLTPPKWVGFENYQKAPDEPRFFPAIRNTLFFALGTVPAGVITSLLLAVLINRAIRGIYFFRAMFYMPVVSSFRLGLADIPLAVRTPGSVSPTRPCGRWACRPPSGCSVRRPPSWPSSS